MIKKAAQSESDCAALIAYNLFSKIVIHDDNFRIGVIPFIGADQLAADRAC